MEVRFNIQEILNWQLHNENLRWAIIDKVEEQCNLYETECTIDITIDGDQLVVTVA